MAICKEMEKQEQSGGRRAQASPQAPLQAQTSPLQRNRSPHGAGPEVPAGQQGSLQECRALLSRPFPRATRDPSSCRDSGAGDDPGGRWA